ncbi:MAG: nucleoside triphosphate pyrophosphohydrolase, partial [Coriobacteriales bacterium]
MEESKSCLPVPEKGEGTGGNFYRFVRIIADLRSENGCPWDREQTHESIARNMIEEAHEAVAAIESGDTADLCEELGDVLLEVVLQAQIAADAGEFDIDDVIDGISDKMVRRHPHVYGDEASFSVLGLTNEEIEQINAVRTPGDVNYIWDVIKVHEKQSKAKAKQRAAAERGEELAPHGVLDDVARSLPALMQAQDISRKAVAYGFEWDTREDVWDKVREEAGEYEEAVASHLGSGSDEEGSSKAAMEEEFGDILFSLVNVARKDGIDAESALRRSCDKFRKRWSLMESYSRDE